MLEGPTLQEVFHSGDFRSYASRESDNGVFVAIDPACEYFFVHGYCGSLTLIRYDVQKDAFMAKNTTYSIEELDIFSMCFLKGVDTPTLCLLHADARGNKHLVR